MNEIHVVEIGVHVEEEALKYNYGISLTKIFQWTKEKWKWADAALFEYKDFLKIRSVVKYKELHG